MRCFLRDLETFKKIMEAPGRGVPYSVRDLAEATGVSRSQIGRLLTGELDNLDITGALAVAEAFGVDLLVLFMPPASQKQGHPDSEIPPT